MTIIKGDFGRQRGEDAPRKKEEAPPPRYQLHVSLAFSDPLIWRRLIVPGEMTLGQLHEVLQLCMNWSGEHSHQFYVGKIFYHDRSAAGEDTTYHEARVDLHSIEEPMRWCFTYIYDAGDGWEHNIVLEEALPPKSGEKCAVVLDGEWAAPPEEVGSIHGYADILNALEHPEDSGNRSLLQQYGLLNFDPACFDMESLNEALRNRGGAI